MIILDTTNNNILQSIARSMSTCKLPGVYITRRRGVVLVKGKTAEVVTLLFGRATKILFTNDCTGEVRRVIDFDIHISILWKNGRYSKITLTFRDNCSWGAIGSINGSSETNWGRVGSIILAIFVDEREKAGGRSPSTSINESTKEFIRLCIIVASKIWGKHTGLKHDGAEMIE